MTNNGSNDFGVEFSRIEFCTKILKSHKNVAAFKRHDDIVYEVNRVDGVSHSLACLDEYACGLGMVMTVLEAFPETDMIFIGGNWNGYTKEAKDYCLDAKIGLYNAAELNGALWAKQPWAYCRKDDEGNPEYQFNHAKG